MALSTKSTCGLVFKCNGIPAGSGEASLSNLDDAIELNACNEVEIADNLLNDRW
ncbi:hypothetical protein [Paenibacillus odorifer]|uniref:hypothetical protein n=1 Tax=Paenibacillus TaxID=44249 RepID=UPI0015BB0000|nr:hypothetical protein [Paenibacillus odorifer]